MQNNKLFHVSAILESGKNSTPHKNQSQTLKNSVSMKSTSRKIENQNYIQEKPSKSIEKNIGIKGKLVPDPNPVQKPKIDINNVEELSAPIKNPRDLLLSKEIDRKTKKNRLENHFEEIGVLKEENKFLKNELDKINKGKINEKNEFSLFLTDFENNFRSKLQENETQLSYYKEINYKLMQENSDKNQKINELTFENKDFSERIETLLIELENLKKINSQNSRNEELESKYNTVLDEYEKKTLENEEKNKEISIWKEKYIQSENLHHQFIQSLKNNDSPSSLKSKEKKEKEDLLIQNENLRKKIIDYEKKLISVISEFDKINSLLIQKEKEILSLKQNTNFYHENSLLKQKNEEQENQIKLLISENQNYKNFKLNISDKEKEISDLKYEISSLQNSKKLQSDSYQREIEKLKSELASINKSEIYYQYITERIRLEEEVKQLKSMVASKKEQKMNYSFGNGDENYESLRSKDIFNNDGEIKSLIIEDKFGSFRDINKPFNLN